MLKEAGPWSGAVLGLLRHLESVGFGGAPRVVGNGYAPDGRMTVTFMPGVSAHPGPWPEDVMERIGGLLRSVHEATASYVPPPDAVWRETWLRTVGDGIRVFGHGDAAPWNLVGPGPGPSALIDWDFAGPIDPLTDLAYAVWLNAQLHDDDVAERHGLPDAVTRARHAHRIMDGYGLPADGRADLVDRMIDVAVQSARAEAILGGVTPDSTEAVSAEGYPTLWAIAWRARSASWMLRHRRVLCRPA
ncbi:aminoglycoside phosphotransferase (APT) family kinase protein [Deinococcus metalli]|uniref:Aminoglycoside phosphotransferase (APT) family kinase protein n=1 Tax=Deinococcus metalli TaxID=1141878 RepID=A0A7W8KEG8_9DEIO|nr:phosphotransferase [Deinococcus metalli]MBB5376646.1 aminoglycoside phosphotransferase (APT) family kinase protein [Deinococcus metalli]GHF42540.1 trifolitoxin immunity protein [Deinococcus metalli]